MALEDAKTAGSADLQQKHTAAIAALETSKSSELAELQKKHDAVLEELKSGHASALADAESSSKKEVEELKASVEHLQTSGSKELADLQAKHDVGTLDHLNAALLGLCNLCDGYPCSVAYPTAMFRMKAYTDFSGDHQRA